MALVHQTEPSDLEKMLIPLPLRAYLGSHSVGEVIETLKVSESESSTSMDTMKDPTLAPEKTGDTSLKPVPVQVEQVPLKAGSNSIEVENPLIKAASGEVQSQVQHGVKKAVKEGLAEMEEAAKEAQQKWVSEAAVLALEDEAKLKKALALDLDQVTSKVKAVQGVQQKVLHNMQHQVQAAVEKITQQVLTNSASVTRNRSSNFFREALGPYLPAINEDEVALEAIRNKALEQQEEAASEAWRLQTSAESAESYLHTLPQMPQVAAHELHLMVDKDLKEVKTATVEAKSAFNAMREAEAEANETLNLANATEEEAKLILANALDQAKEIKELEERAHAQQAQGKKSMLQLRK